MSDEYFNHDGEGSGFFSLILLAVFMLGGFVVARVHEPGQNIGADAAKARLAKLEKIEAGASAKLAGYSVVSKEKGIVSLPVDQALAKVAKLGGEGTRAALVERSIAKDGVDFLTFGPNDLTLSLERHPNHALKTVDDCVRYVARELEGTDAQVCMRAPADEAPRYHDMGVTMILDAGQK